MFFIYSDADYNLAVDASCHGSDGDVTGDDDDDDDDDDDVFF